MKNSLIYQSSDFDCGPTSVTNAMRYLFERSEIPPAVLKHIWAMGIDTFSVNGEPGKEGTSKASMRYMAAWFECFAEKCHFPIKSTFLDMEFAAAGAGSLTWRCLERGGCAVVRCSLNGDGHYVLLTKILSDGTVGLFDPYDEVPDKGDPDRRYIYDQPKRMNRAVRVDILNQQDASDYAMGPLEKREVLLFWRSDAQ
ncbi:MAG: peptidase C39 [Clostridia bacterium]|nr:peptidase C39 [Clostridia bacterium]